MAETNKKIADRLENDAVIHAWDKGKDDFELVLTRCEDCVHHEKYPDDKWIYCIIYDTLKKRDGFCDQGRLMEEN